MTAAIISEKKEQEKWKLNLILQNFPESTSTKVSIQKDENTRKMPCLMITLE